MKKLLSIILSLLLVMSLGFSVPAFAVCKVPPSVGCGGNLCLNGCSDLLSNCLNSKGCNSIQNCSDLLGCISGCDTGCVIGCNSDCDLNCDSTLSCLNGNCKTSAVKAASDSKTCGKTDCAPSLSANSITVKKGAVKSVKINCKKSGVNNSYTNCTNAKIISPKSASTIKV
ncbi:MAG: hypothetical protein IJ725_03690, partial [Ruminococcus sp.]|nr:hypothetical protein [Ruminococcus sp.]